MKCLKFSLGLIFSLFLLDMNCQADGKIQTSFGGTLAYQEAGKKNKHAIVLIHGFPANHKMWNSQVIALKDHFRVITYDLRGLGQSKIQDGQYTLEILVDDFFALLDHLKLERATVIGFSMGGYIALRAIEREPSRFKALVLADTQSAADSDEAKLKRTAALKTIKTDGLHVYAQNFARAALSPKVNTDVIDQLIQMIESNTSVGVSGGLLALISRTNTTPVLPQMNIPTLILVGEEDPITPIKVAQMMRSQINGSRLETISGAGHFSPMENPKAFNSFLLEFLEKTL